MKVPPFISAMQNRYSLRSFHTVGRFFRIKDNEASSVVDNKLHHPKTPHHVQIGYAIYHIIIVLPAMNDLWVKR